MTGEFVHALAGALETLRPAPGSPNTGQAPHRFRVTHVTESSSTADDRVTNTPLVLEYAADVSSRILLAASPTWDEDGDGLFDVVETDKGVRYPAICRGLRWQRILGTFDDRRFTPPPDRRLVRQALGLDPDAQILLTVRRLVPRNGIDRILACAKRLGERAPRLRFLIGGAGELEAPLRREIERENLGRNVELLGFVPEQDLPACYQAADAFLLPTRDLECFGLPVIEAMACGCTPLVIPDGGPPELVTDPHCVAKANSTAAFVALVSDFVAGRIALRGADLAAEARRRYSEQAIQPAVLALVESLGA